MTGADRRKLNKDAGFSLLELLIAVVILAIIVIPLLNLFLSSNKLNIRSRQTLRATTLAQDIMEGLKAYDIEELKAQFTKPEEGFYVIDDGIKGTVDEETAMETSETDAHGNPKKGVYYFSLRNVNMQGSKFDALVRVDASEYMEPVSPDKGHRDALNNDENKPLVLNKAIADARSIDKNNGTFVETPKLRQAVLDSVLTQSNLKAASDPTLPHNLEEALTAAGIDAAAFRNDLTFKDLKSKFTDYERTIEVTLTDSTEKDEDGNPRIQMKVTQTYTFTYGTDVQFTTTGSNLTFVDDRDAGLLDRAHPNINLFYYPLYGKSAAADTIIIKDETTRPTGADDPKLSILIAKQLPTTNDPSDPFYNASDPERLTDAQLMVAESNYRAVVKIEKTGGSYLNKDAFVLKTNLGLNLAGEKYMAGEAKEVKTPQQLTVNGTSMDLSGTSGMNIYTLDGTRSPMGAAGADDAVTELFYNVEVSVYDAGAADKGFPEEERKVVIEGSMNN